MVRLADSPPIGLPHNLIVSRPIGSDDAVDMLGRGAAMSRKKGRIERAYERFLELPVPVVLVVLWLAGAVLLGA